MDHTCSDYKVHNQISSYTTVKSPQSRAVHKILDSKYRAAIKRYNALTSLEELNLQWEKDFKEGAISGPYWAVMTHPISDMILISRIYGECHMASFDCFSVNRQENRVVKKLKTDIHTLNQEIDRAKTGFANERQKHTAEIKRIKNERDALLIKGEENSRLEKTNLSLQHRLAQAEENSRPNETISLLQEERKTTAMLKDQLAALQKNHDKLQHAIDSLTLHTHQQQEELDETKRVNIEQQAELSSMEAFFAAEQQGEMQQGKMQQCSQCEKGCQCPASMALSGKTVLYVGGQHKMIPHYKQMVEQHGADFLHHDGGKENSRHILPKLLNGADAVFCPIDCVSHDACKCVKMICKRNCKPFVMMRSSGLSSLAKSLNEIRQ